ncbi:response regulator [Sphingomonas sp. KC8]|jgi:FixJ family two-component response regulator|uniref:response regulator n=1 Tax=Sphingomonas sp. KC8 TaxID=1030157 RepID=UPI001E4A6A11|nr:response regulator [Sphingomonas sp. KC8]
MRFGIEPQSGAPARDMSLFTSKPPFGQYRVVVSDDDPAVRRALHLLLKGRGYDVCGYTSGRALLGDPRTLDADCIILDYRMPDLDGFYILQALRQQGWTGRAILISGFHDLVLAHRAYEVGFDDVIPKPIIGRAIVDAVRRYSAQAGFGR